MPAQLDSGGNSIRPVSDRLATGSERLPQRPAGHRRSTDGAHHCRIAIDIRMVLHAQTSSRRCSGSWFSRRTTLLSPGRRNWVRMSWCGFAYHAETNRRRSPVEGSRRHRHNVLGQHGLAFGVLNFENNTRSCQGATVVPFGDGDPLAHGCNIHLTPPLRATSNRQRLRPTRRLQLGRVIAATFRFMTSAPAADSILNSNCAVVGDCCQPRRLRPYAPLVPSDGCMLLDDSNARSFANESHRATCSGGVICAAGRARDLL